MRGTRQATSPCRRCIRPCRSGGCLKAPLRRAFALPRLSAAFCSLTSQMRIPIISAIDSGSTAPVFPIQTRHSFRSASATQARIRTPPAQSCPRRRTGVAYDERTTVAVGNSCSAPKVRVRAFAGAVVAEPGTTNVSNVSHRRRLRGDSVWLVPARSRHSRRAAVRRLGRATGAATGMLCVSAYR